MTVKARGYTRRGGFMRRTNVCSDHFGLFVCALRGEIACLIPVFFVVVFSIAVRAAQSRGVGEELWDKRGVEGGIERAVRWGSDSPIQSVQSPRQREIDCFLNRLLSSLSRSHRCGYISLWPLFEWVPVFDSRATYPAVIKAAILLV